MARPLDTVRGLYDAWNAGSVARAAELLAPDIRWENFGEAHVEGVDGLHATLAGPGSGGTMIISAVRVDLLMGAGHHVLSCVRRSEAGGERERFEVWTVGEGRVIRYRGFPVKEGLQVLTDSAGSGRLTAVCRDVAAFNRRQTSGWPATVAGTGPDARLDDIEVMADSPGRLVVNAVRSPGPAEALNLVLEFDVDAVQRVSGYPTAEAALAAAGAVA
jgi:SnoaL-like protein